MKLIDSLITEFDHEAKTTRKHLERLTDDKLDWRPHAKSFTANGLASHIVECVGWTESLFNRAEFDIDMATYRPYEAASHADLLKQFDENVTKGKQALAGVDEASLAQLWQLKMNGKLFLERPRADMFRDFVLSHIIHHRGQFSVYLRLLEIPVPGSYGPSADEQAPGSM